MEISTDSKSLTPTAVASLPFSPLSIKASSSVLSCESTTSKVAMTILDLFLTTQSRVIRLYNLPRNAPEFFLTSIFTSAADMPTPTSFWTSPFVQAQTSVWASFASHEQACTALFVLSKTTMSVIPVLEREIESLRPLHLNDPVHDAKDYILSTNPPNPRTTFRLGDWICGAPNCAAHNFGRNQSCIGCGSLRTSLAQSAHSQSPRFKSASSTPLSLSPRSLSFPSTPSSPSFPPHMVPPKAIYCNGGANPPNVPPVPAQSHPLLTPSGRAFAVGGRVQNISSDPLAPCVMYWPDNEPLPEQGQIRPNTSAGLNQPPILNTGNRGPISHQPGDWICQKCNYLNWRRRKVCQTCLPYAEGNGDSISAAVQAERIALLTSVLAQSPSPYNPSLRQQSAPVPPAVWRSQSLTPPQARSRQLPAFTTTMTRTPIRSQSHFELSTQYHDARPIYQTSARQPSPLALPHHQADQGFSQFVNPTTLYASQLVVPGPTPLLPSFLQEIVQSPSHSPQSTSSAELSLEEYSSSSGSNPSYDFSERSKPAVRGMSGDSSEGGQRSCSNTGLSIWSLDGEEYRSVTPYNKRKDFGAVGSSRNSSQEALNQLSDKFEQQQL